MCHSHVKKQKINRLHGRCLKLIYNYKISTFKQLLGKISSFSIHARNLRFLVVGMLEVVMGLTTRIFSDLFPLKEQNNYSLP